MSPCRGWLAGSVVALRVLCYTRAHALVAQLAEATDSKPVQCEFESHQGHCFCEFKEHSYAEIAAAMRCRRHLPGQIKLGKRKSSAWRTDRPRTGSLMLEKGTAKPSPHKEAYHTYRGRAGVIVQPSSK